MFYRGQFKAFTGQTSLLRVWTGTAWAWVKFRLAGGREWPPRWRLESPRVVRRGARWERHVGLTPEHFRFPPRAEKQLARAETRLCAVDLTLNDALAVCTLQRADGTVLATRFIRGGRALQGRRKCALGRAARRRAQTGRIQSHATDNARRFRPIRALDHDAAHRVSRRIVEFALAYGATVIALEHLATFRPARGRYSRRGNERRASWLRGRSTGSPGTRRGSTACSPVGSTRATPAASAPGAARRWRAMPRAYRPGAPLFRCPACRRRCRALPRQSRRPGARAAATRAGQDGSPGPTEQRWSAGPGRHRPGQASRAAGHSPHPSPTTALTESRPGRKHPERR